MSSSKCLLLLLTSHVVTAIVALWMWPRLQQRMRAYKLGSSISICWHMVEPETRDNCVVLGRKSSSATSVEDPKPRVDADHTAAAARPQSRPPVRHGYCVNGKYNGKPKPRPNDSIDCDKDCPSNSYLESWAIYQSAAVGDQTHRLYESINRERYSRCRAKCYLSGLDPCQEEIAELRENTKHEYPHPRLYHILYERGYVRRYHTDKIEHDLESFRKYHGLS